MWVDPDIIVAAAQLIAAGLADLPVDDWVDSRGYGTDDADTLAALIDELSWADLCLALRSAAGRLPEPTYDDDEPVEDVVAAFDAAEKGRTRPPTEAT